jgi:hypothetical protein
MFPMVRPSAKRRRTLGVVACAVVLASCGEEPPGATKSPDAGRVIPGPRNEDGGPPYVPPMNIHTYAPTFAAIHQEIFIPTCAAVFCHFSDELFFNSISADRAYETLVGAVTTSPDCGPTGLERVAPGHPEQSLLYLKLTAPPCGRKMPIGYVSQLPSQEIEQIRVWIERGAPRYEADE